MDFMEKFLRSSFGISPFFASSSFPRFTIYLASLSSGLRRLLFGIISDQQKHRQRMGGDRRRPARI